MELSLGTFGDVCLDKRGRKSSYGCLRVKRCACASWAATARVSCRPGGSLCQPQSLPCEGIAFAGMTTRSNVTTHLFRLGH